MAQVKITYQRLKHFQERLNIYEKFTKKVPLPFLFEILVKMSIKAPEVSMTGSDLTGQREYHSFRGKNH